MLTLEIWCENDYAWNLTIKFNQIRKSRKTALIRKSHGISYFICYSNKLLHENFYVSFHLLLFELFSFKWIKSFIALFHISSILSENLD